MKKRKEVITHHLVSDDSAWADLLLSKTALILATVIILMAVYTFAGSYSSLVKKDEVEIIAADIASNIDSIGSAHSDRSTACLELDTENYELKLSRRNDLNISISSEYVFCTLKDNGQDITAARQLSYRTLTLNPQDLCNILTGSFGADGNINQPINSEFSYTDVTDLLANKGNEELYLNTSKELYIKRTTVFVADGREVNELEYVLVYQ
ncbi:hypothetical protein [Methanolobus bombayensis]|uniref:hypothetical protein n=1 Tax=Methanolobus bombayensis TaxID=38023 RepID=UPI001AE444A5|nr:hypothetical protein [Methanolobus bombayensis]MBP1908819.1 hypothetical protein [Methanolobus bombayensis]